MLNRCLSSIFLRLLALVSRWLKKPLHRYVSFKRDRPFFTLGLTGFTIKFEHLQLLQQAWNSEFLRASLPLQLHSFLIESVSVHFGVWSAVTVEASGVFVLLKTTNNKFYNAEVERESELATKRVRLEALHFTGEKVPVQKPSWIRQQILKLGKFLLFALIKRMEISASQVHLRLEDEQSSAEEPVATGVVVEGAALANAQSEKTADVQNASVYWNVGKNRELFSHSDEAAATAKLREFPFKDALGCDYVLKPTSIQGDLVLRKGSHLYFDIALSLRILKTNTLKAQISKEQLDSVTKFLGFIKQQEHSRCFLEFRPHVPPVDKDGIRQWWQYAFNGVVKYLKGRKGKTVWDRLTSHRSLYRVYSELYEVPLIGKKLSAKEKLKMKAMEEQMELLEIVSCRSRVWKTLRLRRLVEDLSDHLLSNNSKKLRVSKEVLEVVEPEMSAFSLSLNFECDAIQLLLTEASVDDNKDSTILKVDGSGLDLGLSHQPHVSSVRVKIDSFVVSGSSGTRMVYESKGPQTVSPFRAPPSSSSSDDRQPLLSVGLKVGHKPPGPFPRTQGRRLPAVASEEPDADVTDHHVMVKLKQMVFIFDKQTALRLTAVAALLFKNFNADLRFYLKEQAHELKYQGEKKIEEVVTNREIISVTADAHLPILILPGSSERHSSGDLAAKLGHLQVMTSVENGESCVVKLKGKLSGTVVAFNLQDESWRGQASKDFTSGNSTKLLNCPQVDAGVTTTFSDPDSTPRVMVNGSISSVDLGMSNGILEAGVAAASYHIDTLLELAEVVMSAQAREKEGTRSRHEYHRYVSKTELTPSRLVEVAARINQPLTPISRQSLEGGVAVEEVDGRGSVSPKPNKDLPILKVSFLIHEISLEVTSEMESLLNYLGGSIEGIRLELEQGRHGLQCRLDMSSGSLVDSCINSKGSELRPPYPVLALQSTKSEGQFFTAHLHKVDSILAPLGHNAIKNAVTADIGSLALSISDAFLFSWVEILVGYYVQICSIDLARLSAHVVPGRPKASPPSPRRALRNIPPHLRNTTEEKISVEQRKGKGVGVINFNVRVGVAEVVVTLRSGNTSITKLCVSGIRGELKDSIFSTECTGSVDSVVLLDCLQVIHSKVVSSNVSERVLQMKSSLKKKAPPSPRPRTIAHASSRPRLDPEALSTDLRADITVGGVACTVLFSFVTTLQGYLANIASHVSEDLQVLKPSQGAVVPEMSPRKSESKPFKCNLSLNMHSLSVKFPASGNSSTESVRVQLESLLLSNQYSSGHELSGARGESYLSVAETVQLDFHQLSVSRFDKEEQFELACIPEFKVSLSRLLPTGIPMRALLSEPQVKVTVAAEILEVYASNHDLYAVFLVIQGNIGEEPTLCFVGQEPTSTRLTDESKEGSTNKKQDEVGKFRERAEEEEEEEEEEVVGRSLLQLDVSLKKMKWTLHYIESSKSVLPSGNPLHVVIVEMNICEIFSLVDVDSSANLHGVAMVTDITMKELPNNHGYNSLDCEDPFILNQVLYYRKTKPPKLGGGTMDTRRATPGDTVVKAEFDYSNGDVEVGLTVQHLHMCVWPHLITPFLASTSSAPPPSSTPGRDQKNSKPERKGTGPAKGPKVSVTLGVNNLTLALLDKPSDVTSYGVCAEVIHPDCKQFSKIMLMASTSEVQLSSDALHFEASMMQFGKKVAKLVQVVDPCSLGFSLKMAESEELAKITASPIVVSLSMESISAILKSISKAFSKRTSEPRMSLVHKPSKLENIWELKTVGSEAIPLAGRAEEGRGGGGVGGDQEEEEVDGEAEEVFSDDVALDVISKDQRAELSLPLVVVNFDLICGGNSNTMISLTSSVEAVATTWSSKLEVDAKLEASGFIHNQRVSAWEPLLEPLEEPVQGKYRRWAVIAKVRHIDSDVNFSPVYRDSVRGSISVLSRGSGGSTASEALTDFVAPLLEGPEEESREGGRSPRLGAREKLEKIGREMEVVEEEEEEGKSSLVLLISSDDRLEVTLSPGAVETLLKIMEATRLEEADLEKNLAGCLYFNVHPMVIRNQTGLTLTMYPGPAFALGDSLFGKHINLFPGDPAHSLTTHVFEHTDSGAIASALAAVTTAVLGGRGSPAKPSSNRDVSMVQLHYANEGLKSGRSCEGRGPGASEEDEEDDKEAAIAEEWDGIVSYFMGVSGRGKNMQAKTDSLTKLRNHLQKHKTSGENADLRPPAWKAVHSLSHGLSNHHRICIQSKGGKKSRPIPVSLPGLVPIPLVDQSSSGIGYGKKLVGVCEVEEVDEVRIVTIRSSVQIRNDYPLNVTLYQHSELGTKQLALLRPGDAYNLPVPLYMEKTPLKIGIGESGFFGEDVLDWSSMMEEVGKPVHISCPADLSSRRKYYLQALMSLQTVATDPSLINAEAHLISLKPTLVFHNLLPLTVRVAEKDSHFEHRHHHTKPTSPKERRISGTDSNEITVLEAGQTKNLAFVDPTRVHELAIEIPNYKGAKWRGVLALESSSSYRSHLRVKLRRIDDGGDYSGDYTKMKIGVYSDLSSPSLYRLHCPYWVCNRTGLSMEYEYYSPTLYNVKGVVDDGSENSPTLVYFKPGLENKDKKLRLRVGHDGQLSKTIYLGNTGEAAEITAKAKDGTVYELSVQNSYSLHVLTQVVHILPKYVVHNTTAYQVRLSGYSESTRKLAEDHIVLDSNELKVFWPNTHKVGVVHLHGSRDQTWLHASLPFHLTKIGTLSLPLRPGDEVLSAVTVKVSPAHSGSLTLVTISPYLEGTAVYRLENLSRKLILKIRQSISRTELVIPAGHTKLYSWHDPLLPWELYWQVLGERPNSWTLMEEVFEGGSREVSLGDENGAGTRKISWRMGYDGSQKVFQLFDSTQDRKRVEKASHPPSLRISELLSKDSSLKPTSFQVFCSMEGVGLSLLNDKPVEVMYCTIQSSPVVWLKRNRDGGKFRVLEDSQLQLDLEGSWRTGVKEKKIDSETFNLSTLRGNKGGTLMRSFNSGLWGFLLVTESHLILRAAVGRVQVDNQLEDYTLNRVIFAAEKGMGSKSSVAAMIDAAVVIRRPYGKQQITLFEDGYVKVKNLQVNAELGVVAAIIPLMHPLFSVQGLQGGGEVFAYSAISSAAKTTIEEILLKEAPGARSNVQFKGLAISPIEIAVTYTSIVAGPYNFSSTLGNVVDSIIHISSTIVNGNIPIKLDSFKFNGETGATELFTILFGHYRNEVLGNIHSVLFGLDLIGNPSKLISNIETGIKELIDETEQGFERHTRGSGVTGVAVGVKDLLGQVIVGSTESLGGTTRSFRNALLETTDLDYKRRHRQLEHVTSETLGGNLLLGTRFFAEGLIGGLTDIFTQPISGASSGGAKGFFHGLGKGALAILTKPTLGVVDLAYFTLEGIRSFADEDSEVQTVRLPRRVHPSMIVTPYNIHEAQGLNILWRNPDNSKGTQYYGHHWLPTEDGKDPRLLLVNSLYILKLKRSGKFFKEADDLNIKLEYLQEWEAVVENDDTASLFLKYGDDGKLDKLSSFLGFGKVDHYAEVTDKTAMIEVDSPQTGRFLAGRITEACRGVLIHYAKLMSSSK